MRIVLPVAMLFAASTAVSAQEAARVAEPVPVTAPAPAVTTTAPAVTTEKPASSVVVKSRFEQVRTTPAETSAATQTVPRGWWWTVGAIVLALVIVALIL